LLNVPKRGLFGFSKTEYIANANTCLSSSKRKLKTLTFERQDNSGTDPLKINLYGYPVCPMPHLSENEDVATDFQENLAENEPDIILVQHDPMTFLGRARAFASNNMPLLRE
jgi:hypothetical protein